MDAPADTLNYFIAGYSVIFGLSHQLDRALSQPAPGRKKPGRNGRQVNFVLSFIW
jgi:hypothetical protein